MKMKISKLMMAVMTAVCAVACVNGPDSNDVQFGVDSDIIRMGPEGGVHVIKVSSPGDWVAMTESPWITVSPANGRGSAECQVRVDSALFDTPRTGYIRIQSLNTDDKSDFSVEQEGFEYQIVLDNTEVEVEDFAEYDSRHFEVYVKSNVQFDVVLPEGTSNWLSVKQSKLDLGDEDGKGPVMRRPRGSLVRFDWEVNTRDERRIADIVFQPKDDVVMGRQDTLKIVQKASLPIPVGTPAGDSLSLLAISRAIGSYIEWDTSEKMEHWNNVAVWKEGPDKGRVKYVQFFMFSTKESLPYEVQNLTAAEEIAFYSNSNHFLRSLDTGEYITKLTQLKRLTIGAYGLTSLHPDFVNLKNLEFLDISSNCFQEIPDILTPENFPNLHAIVMNANQRNTIYDLSNDIRENIGGFIDDDLSTSQGMESLKRILKWENLDTIRLSVNYIQGELPDLMEDGLPTWTFEELKDSLATGATALPAELQNIPKVLPNTTFFAINFNRLYGKLPNWLLYHPKLDFWTPYSLVFSQEGKTRNGLNAGFRNEPTSLDYYYEVYPNKKYNPNNIQN